MFLYRFKTNQNRNPFGDVLPNHTDFKDEKNIYKVK